MRYTTEADCCRDALLAQSACNLNGLARSLVEMLDCLNRVLGWGSSAQHPAVQLMLHQMAYLSHGREPFDWDYSAAYKHCADEAVRAGFVQPEHREP
mgnify:CR=1 FL=1